MFDGALLSIGASLDTLSLFAQTVAFQNSPSGFVGLISFVNILYALMADIFIFDEEIDLKEMLAATVILLVTVCVTIYKLSRNKLDNTTSVITTK